MIVIIKSCPFECFIIFFWQATSKEMIHHCVLLIVFIILSMTAPLTLSGRIMNGFSISQINFVTLWWTSRVTNKCVKTESINGAFYLVVSWKFMKIFLNIMLIMYTINTWIFWPAFISFLMVCHLGWCVGNFIYVHFTFVACIE